MLLFRPPLLRPQRDYRIDPRRPPRRQQPGDDTHREAEGESDHDEPEGSGKGVDRGESLAPHVDLAGEGGDAALMLAAIETIGADFDVDALDHQRRALKKFAAGATTSTEINAFVETSEGVIDRALADERYDVALDLAERAYRLCQRSHGREFRKRTHARHVQVQKLHRSWQKIQQVLATLETNPEDPEANLAVGRWYCFDRGDWQQGLPYLAKSSDERLKALATQEIESPPSEPSDQVRLADAWWELAQTAKDQTKDAMLLRAGSWYEQAWPKVTSVVLRSKLAKRLKELDVKTVKLWSPASSDESTKAQRPPAGEQRAKLGSGRRQPSSVQQEPALPKGVIAEDREQRFVGGDPRSTIYILKAPAPVSLSRTAIRFRGDAGVRDESNGRISLSLDGASWVPVGKWSEASCVAAQRNTDGWQTILLPAMDQKIRPSEIRLKFEYVGGYNGLRLYHVVWAKN